MSKLAKEWIEANFKITRQLDPLERCLSDGYILVSICRQQGLVGDMEFEDAIDTPGPDTAMVNLKIVAKALRKVSIKLTKSDVASIVSEQSGFSPSLVMSMKKGFESKGDHRVKTPEYKNSIRSLRKQEFVRESIKVAGLSPEAKALNDTVMTYPDLSSYRDIDSTAQFADYEVYRYQVEEYEDKKCAGAAIAQREIADQKYREQLEKDHHKYKYHQDMANSLVKNWKATQRTKKDRRIRDTQFELAVQTKRDLSKLDADMKHTKDQIQGIESFEHSLKRNGLGGTDDSRPLAISYEDAEAYIGRLEELAVAKLPTKEETNDFVLGLKTRTAENRFSRLEKARRKRRALVEQLAAQNATLNATADLNENKEMDDEEQESAMNKAAEKVERDAKLTAKSKEAHANLMETAEDKLRIFLEEQRLLHDDMGKNEKAYYEVCEAQVRRKEDKTAATTDFCKTIVLEMVKAALLITLGEEFSNPAAESSSNLLDVDLAKSIIDNVHSLSSGKCGVQQASTEIILHGGSDLTYDMFTSEIVSIESWPVYAAMANNIGTKKIVSEVVDVSTPLPVAAAAVEKGEGGVGDPADSVLPDDEYPSSKGEAGDAAAAAEPVADTVESTDAAKMAVDESAVATDTTTNAIDDIVGTDNVLAVGDVESKLITRVEATDSLLSTVQMISEAILKGSSGSSSKTDDSMYTHVSPTSTELKEHSSNQPAKSRVIMLLGQGNDSSLSTWKKGLQLIGSQSIELWDLVNGLEVAEKLKPMLVLEGKAKVPVIKLDQLAGVFASFQRSSVNDESAAEPIYPDALSGLEASPGCVKVMTDLVESFNKFDAFEVVVAAEGSKDHITFKDITFNDVTLFSLMGQVLWVREYLREQWLSVSETNSCPLPTFLLVTRSYGRSRDNGWSLAVFDWFLRGGNRDNIPDTADPEFKSYVTSSLPGAGGKPGKDDPVIPTSSAVAAVIWVKSKYTARNIFSDDDKVYEFDLTKYTRAMNQYEYTSNEADTTSDPAASESILINYTMVHTEILSVFCMTEETEWPCAFQEKGIDVVPVKGDFLLCELVCGIMSCLSEREKAREEAAKSIEGSPDTKVAEEGESLKKEFDLHQSKVIHELVLERRKSLPPAQSISLSHFLGEKPLNLRGVYNNLEKLYFSHAQDICFTGGLLAACNEVVQRLFSRLRRDEAIFIAGFKSMDGRWNFLCDQFSINCAAAMNSLNAQQNKVMANDLICSIGDSLDERHMNWSDKVDRFEETALDVVCDAMSTLTDILKIMAQEWKGVGVETDSSWLSMASLEVPGENTSSGGGGTTIRQELWTELLFNTLDRSLCIVTAFKSILEEMKTWNVNLISRLKSMISIRHNYEIEYLRRWGKDMIQHVGSTMEKMNGQTSEYNSLSGGGISNSNQRSEYSTSAVSSISIAPFRPSIDVKDDNIVWKDGCGDLELGEMTLNIDTIREFAVEIVLQLNQRKEFSRQKSGDSIFLEFVKVCVSGLENRCYDISYPWKHPDKLSAFISQVIGKEKGGESVDGDEMIEENACSLLIYLILGILPKGFSDRTLMFLLGEAKKLIPEKQNISEETEDERASFTELLVPTKLYMKKIAAATHLKDVYGQDNYDMYQKALESLVIFSTKSEDMISINKFLPLVCRSVVLPSMVNFANQLVHQGLGEHVLDNSSGGGASSSATSSLCPGMMRVGTISKYLKPYMSIDNIPLQLNKVLGAHLDAEQIALYFGIMNNGSTLSGCGERCAKVVIKYLDPEGSTEEDNSRVEFQTFESDVIYVAELSKIQNKLSDENARRTINNCEIIFQGL